MHIFSLNLAGIHEPVLTGTKKSMEKVTKKMGDRSGGREAKGASLKKSKKNPGSTAAKAKKVASKGLSGPLTSLPPPQPGKTYFITCHSLIGASTHLFNYI